MSNPFIPRTKNDFLFQYDLTENQETQARLISITDTIIRLLTEEAKVFSKLLQEWMKLSALLTKQPVAQSYVTHWRWMNSLLSESIESTMDRNREHICQQDADSSAESGREKPEHLKILLLSWEFPPHIVGGLSRHVYGLTKSLAKNGHEIHIITAGTDHLPVLETIDDVIIHRVKPLCINEKDFLLWIGGLNIAIAEKAAALATEKSFDCIHSHDWLVGAAAISLKKHLALPLVTTIHATEYGRNNGIYTEMQRFIHEKEKQLVEQSDQLIVCSDFMKGEVQKLFKAADQKLAIIPNGIEDKMEIGNAQKDYLGDIEVDPDQRVIFSIGRMVKEKGFDTLIDAAAVLKGNGIPVLFIIGGKGPMLEVYRRKVSEMNLTDTVQFIGFIEDDKRNRLLDLAEIAVFPSLYEPFGIVALEAMQAGKPTIVSNTGGLKGIVRHLETGILIEPANSDDIAAQITHLLMNPDLANDIGKNAKKAVQSQFSWNVAAVETRQLYNKILNTRKHQ